MLTLRPSFAALGTDTWRELLANRPSALCSGRLLAPLIAEWSALRGARSRDVEVCWSSVLLFSCSFSSLVSAIGLLSLMSLVLRIPRGSFSFSEFALGGDLASFPDHQPAAVLYRFWYASLPCQQSRAAMGGMQRNGSIPSKLAE